MGIQGCKFGDVGLKDARCDVVKNKFGKKIHLHCFCMGILFNLTASGIY